MKLFGFIILLSLTVTFLAFNQSYAQVSSLNSTSDATIPYAVPSLNSTSNGTTPDVTFQDFYKHGNDLFDHGKYQEAVFFYNKALSIDPANINALYNKALALDKLGKIN